MRKKFWREMINFAGCKRAYAGLIDKKVGLFWEKCFFSKRGLLFEPLMQRHCYPTVFNKACSLLVNKHFKKSIDHSVFGFVNPLYSKVYFKIHLKI
jgi:hypothetical protein